MNFRKEEARCVVLLGRVNTMNTMPCTIPSNSFIEGHMLHRLPKLGLEIAESLLYLGDRKIRLLWEKANCARQSAPHTRDYHPQLYCRSQPRRRLHAVDGAHDNWRQYEHRCGDGTARHGPLHESDLGRLLRSPKNIAVLVLDWNAFGQLGTSH